MTAIDVRVGPAPAPQADHDPDEWPAPRPAQTGPTRNPHTGHTGHTAYQELRRQMREHAAARQGAIDESAAQREAIRCRHDNRLREPEDAHRAAIEEGATTGAGSGVLSGSPAGAAEHCDLLPRG
ncbi:hypothetical protein ACIPYS_06680 [Kitasatospora sp. NPDC089913]|uniref:hypothetical protein n=1 Tax=Kitasatospora sp. NPDC089913 TaxID=3364080 RepID=UPI00381B4D49